jgi:two-component sensor histidine kinase
MENPILPPVPWPQLASFVRQLSHDLRNDLNAIGLEASLLKEIVEDPEARGSAQRIQNQLHEMSLRLKSISTRYVLPTPLGASVSITELYAHLASVAGRLDWQSCDLPGELQTDVLLFGRGFQELAENALRHSAPEAQPSAEIRPDGPAGATVVLIEPGATEYPWPETPFAAPRTGRYGVGLCLAAAIFTGLGVIITRRKTPTGLETHLIFPSQTA